MEDMTNIQKVARQALKTFKTANRSPAKENLDVLKSMVRRPYIHHDFFAEGYIKFD